ncbi:MAG TPA: DUF1080 domain-containing protein [Gemmataceae bacterium]|jgi:hypothetical protein
MRSTLLFLALVTTALLGADSPTKSAGDATKDTGFFNGKDLEGWEGVAEYWSVKDGAIVGHPPKDPGYNNFLCSKKKYGDFAMSFKVRIKDGKGNSGVQIRSKLLDPKKYVVGGPQADIGQGFWGSLYGEQFDGERFAREEGFKGPKMMKQSPGGVVQKVVKQSDFNDYSIRCVGKHVTIKVNGETMVDDDFPKMPEEGIIAFQLHAGYGAMEVTYKDIQFKDLSKK